MSITNPLKCQNISLATTSFLRLILKISRLRMDSEQFVSLAFIFVVNVLFLFSGICLNALVIISFSRSKQLRKKLCYFMIMVLSCCDFLAVITNNLFVATIAILTLTGKLRVHQEWIHICFKMTQIFPIFSLHALVVMNFDRYLATSRPFFHRRSVTKKRLAILFTVLILAETFLATLSANDAVISYQAHVTFVSVVVVPLTFVNLKLFVIARRNSRKNRISPGIEEVFVKKYQRLLVGVRLFRAHFGTSIPLCRTKVLFD